MFSRYPIIDAFIYRYSLNGYMYNITHGDWFGGKAVGYCLIDHPKQPIHFFASHVSLCTYQLCLRFNQSKLNNISQITFLNDKFNKKKTTPKSSVFPFINVVC